MTYCEMIAVIQAYMDSKLIESKSRDGRGVWAYVDSPKFDFVSFDYRVMPEQRKPKVPMYQAVFCLDSRYYVLDRLYRSEQEALKDNSGFVALLPTPVWEVEE